jgi:hypothetical protein
MPHLPGAGDLNPFSVLYERFIELQFDPEHLFAFGALDSLHGGSFGGILSLKYRDM